MELWEMTNKRRLDGREIENRIDEIDEEYRHDEDGELLDVPTWGKDVEDEYRLLLEIRDAVEGYGGDKLRDTELIADEDFVEYAREYADNIGRMSLTDGHTADWPHYHIDWEAAAKDLQSDFTSVEIGEGTYWFR